jgi:hypothetical protein
VLNRIVLRQQTLLLYATTVTDKLEHYAFTCPKPQKKKFQGNRGRKNKYPGRKKRVKKQETRVSDGIPFL